jgi:CRP-like cAMP-binding protein
MKRGQFFGEIAIVQVSRGCVRTADVICLENCDLLELTKDTILSIVDDAPKLYAALQVCVCVSARAHYIRRSPGVSVCARVRARSCLRYTLLLQARAQERSEAELMPKLNPKSLCRRGHRNG